MFLRPDDNWSNETMFRDLSLITNQRSARFSLKASSASELAGLCSQS